MPAPWRDWLVARLPSLKPPQRRYVLDAERVVLSTHRHWAVVAEPVLSAALGLVLALWIDVTGPLAGSALGTLVWLCWLGLAARAGWNILEWRHSWFIATEKRLVLTYGLITQRVDMMPLRKVTDMSYSRSVPGRILGYGTFIMESAGADQALREIHWIDHPDRTYRSICAEIFGIDDSSQRADEDELPDEGPPGGGRPPGGAGPRGDSGRGAGSEQGTPGDPEAAPSGRAEVGQGQLPPDHSRAIPTTGGARRVSEISLYRSEDLRRRDACPDTGPIEYFPAEHDVPRRRDSASPESAAPSPTPPDSTPPPSAPHRQRRFDQYPPEPAGG